MSPIRLDVVTAERLVYSEQVDMVIAPGSEGDLGILPNHEPLMTMLNPGEMVVRQGDEEFSLAISGGFLEIRPDRIIVLADSAERDYEIDMERAEEARRRARERIDGAATDLDVAHAEAALRRSLARLKVAQKVRRRRGENPQF
jgi:F-type H+-transporting ATPase subunit epsilon